jgi:hypothetical protein
MYVEVKSLSDTMRKVLKAAGYARADIKVIPVEEIDIGSAGATGERAFTYVVNLTTGEYKGTYGSWGGPNMFTNNIVDTGGLIHLPPNGAVVKGSSGRSTFATIYCHPQAMGNMLPSAEPQEELTAEEQQAIYCYTAIKGGEYRREELMRRRVSSATVAGLVERGYLKQNKAGAIQATTKGKNARTVRY